MFTFPTIFLILFTLASALPTTLPDLNDTLTQQSNLTFRPINCISTLSTWSKQWLPPTSQPSFNPADCLPALRSFYSFDVVLKPNTPRDFSAHGVYPPSPPSPGKGPLSGIQTPRKYVSGSCTLGIMNLDVVTRRIGMSDLPGISRMYPWPESDTEKFRTMYEQASKILSGCLDHERVPGWIQTGEL